MTRDEIVQIAWDVGLLMRSHQSQDKPTKLERFAERIAAAEKQKVVVYMNSRAFATGHGDTIDDLLKELEWQVAEREREACAKLAGPHLGGAIAAAIRARGEV
jgi:hypothetical protein